MKRVFMIFCLIVLTLCSCAVEPAAPAESLSTEPQLDSNSETSLGNTGESIAATVDAENDSDSEVIADDAALWDDDTFLERAYAMGFTDEMLATLRQSSISPESLLAPEENQPADLTKECTSDGRYQLFALWDGGVDERVLFCCLYVKDAESGGVRVLPELSNVYSSHGLLGNDHMYSSIVQVGGTDTRSGLRIYSLEDVCTPVGVWYPDGDVPLTGGTVVMSNAILFPERECFIVFWAVLPEGLDTLDEEALAAAGTYKATVIDYHGNAINEFDTDMALKSRKLTVLLPAKGVKSLLSEAGKLVFEFDSKEYTLDLDTGEILKRERT